MSDPLSGHWILDRSRSSFSAHAPAAWELFIEADSAGMSVEERLTQAGGATLHVRFSPKFDGGDWPVTGSPLFDSIAVLRPQVGRLDVTARKSGAIAIRDTTEVSTDDGRLTIRFEVFAEQRVVATGLAVFARAPG